MFNFTRALFVTLMMMFSYNANADFFSGNDCPPWEYDCNDWPEWTPMYWMEEFSNEFDDDDDYYRYGAPYGGPMPYGPPPMPYGAPMMPQGGPMPYGAPMPQGGPMPYGAPMPQGRPMPYGRPPMMPYGAPQPPFGGPVPPYGRPAAPPAPAPAN